MINAMRRSLLPAVAACALLVAMGAVGTASAATVRVLTRNGHTRVTNNPYLSAALMNAGPAPTSLLSAQSSDAVPSPLAVAIAPPTELSPVTAAKNSAARLEASTAAALKRDRHTLTKRGEAGTASARPAATVLSVLLNLLRKKEITGGAYSADRTIWRDSLAEEKILSSPRRAQLSDVTDLLSNIAARGKMSAARCAVLFLTLERNAEWWINGSMLSYPDRVQFSGDPIVWEYYPGYGLQLQVLGTMGEADGYYESGTPANLTNLETLLSEMETLSVPRAGGKTWEYYFYWEGGAPPWVSAMAQGTAIEAFTGAYQATLNTAYLTYAHRLLPLLETAPPTGAAVKTSGGLRFVQYSFTPQTNIINAFLQTLIGLDDYAKVSKDPTAIKLFDKGNRIAQKELPSFVVQGWSLYQPGELDNLNYHTLVTGFAEQLCELTSAPVYCHVAADFESDLLDPPTITQLTTHAHAGQAVALAFKINQIATVGVIVTRNGKNYLSAKAQERAGTHAFTTQRLPAGVYEVTISATDLAGHRSAVTGALTAS